MIKIRDVQTTTLMDVLNCVNGKGGEMITLDVTTITELRKCIDKMIELGAL